MAKKNYQELKLNLVDDEICPICKTDLYYDEVTSKRIGLIDESDEVIGWMCPTCDSQFSLNSQVTNIYGEMKVEAKA